MPGYVDRLNNRWLREPIGNIPLVEAEECHYAMMAETPSRHGSNKIASGNPRAVQGRVCLNDRLKTFKVMINNAQLVCCSPLLRWIQLPLSALLIFLISSSYLVAEGHTLRVGVVGGSAPCIYRNHSEWRGIAIVLWRLIADHENLPYTVSEWPSINSMLEATRSGDLDLAVGCVNISPDRYSHFQFTLPYQEDGQAVMVKTGHFNYGRAIMKSLASPTLALLLGTFISLILLMGTSKNGLSERPVRVSCVIA
jgi:hypothetical protein